MDSLKRDWNSSVTGLIAGLMLCACVGAEESRWELETWSIPFDYTSPTRSVSYQPLEHAERKWRICASYPHLKDSCLTPTVLEIAERIPVVAVVNDIADPGISAKAGVSWTIMGSSIGEYLARQHPEGSEPIKVAWFPGPKGSGWVPFVEAGFRGALEESSAQIVVTKYGDTGKEIQLILLEEALEERPDVDYIVGSAVTAEAAVSVLRMRGLYGQIKILADYFTHAVYRGIKRKRIQAAPTDFPVVQGRLGIEQAVRLLENKLEIIHLGPAIKLVDLENVDQLGTGTSLAPASFTPTFIVE